MPGWLQAVKQYSCGTLPVLVRQRRVQLPLVRRAQPQSAQRVLDASSARRRSWQQQNQQQQRWWRLSQQQQQQQRQQQQRQSTAHDCWSSHAAVHKDMEHLGRLLSCRQGSRCCSTMSSSARSFGNTLAAAAAAAAAQATARECLQTSLCRTGETRTRHCSPPILAHSVAAAEAAAATHSRMLLPSPSQLLPQLHASVAAAVAAAAADTATDTACYRSMLLMQQLRRVRLLPPQAATLDHLAAWQQGTILAVSRAGALAHQRTRGVWAVGAHHSPVLTPRLANLLALGCRAPPHVLMPGPGYPMAQT
jgi:hypothetical protein